MISISFLCQIRTNAVNPTATMTDMGRFAWSDPVKADPLRNRIPLNRFAGNTNDTSKVYAGLALSRCAHVKAVLIVNTLAKSKNLIRNIIQLAVMFLSPTISNNFPCVCRCDMKYNNTLNLWLLKPFLLFKSILTNWNIGTKFFFSQNKWWCFWNLKHMYFHKHVLFLFCQRWMKWSMRCYFF